MTQLENCISKLKKCYREPDIVNMFHLKDNFSFSVSMTVVIRAIENKEITAEELIKCLQSPTNK